MDSEFDRFWEAYGLKKDKAVAERAFVRAVRKASFERIMEGVQKYRAELKTEQRKGWAPSQKYPATWLNGLGWENYSGVATRAEKKPGLPGHRWASPDEADRYWRGVKGYQSVQVPQMVPEEWEC